MALFDKAKEFFAGFSFLVLKYFLQLLKTQMIILLWGKYSTDPFIPKNGAQMNSVRSCYIACGSYGQLLPIILTIPKLFLDALASLRSMVFSQYENSLT